MFLVMGRYLVYFRLIPGILSGFFENLPLHIYTPCWIDRGTVKVKCLAYEQNAIVPKRYFLQVLLNQLEYMSPFTLKISLEILLTVYHTILIVLVQRIWFGSVDNPYLIFSFNLVTCLLAIVLIL